MDKYQEKLLSKTVQLSLSSDSGNGLCVINESSLTLQQNENYKIVQYLFKIVNPAIEKILIDDKTFKPLKSVISFDVDFNAPFKKAVIYFINDVAEPLELAAVYNYSDRVAFDTKMDYEIAEKNRENMHLALLSDSSLLNIFFKKSNESVTNIELKVEAVFASEKYIVLQETIATNIEFKAVNHLTAGQYFVTIVEKDSSNNIIAKDTKNVFVKDINTKFDELSGKLEEVRGQVRASGKGIVVSGNRD